MAELELLRQVQDVVTAPAGSPSLEGLGTESRDVAERAKDWLDQANVVGTGVANRVVAGQTTDELALKVYVVTKRPRRRLSERRRIPETVTVPDASTDPVAIDVEEIGRPRLQANTSRMRPMIPGYSVGLAGVETGTIGCFVAESGLPDRPLILSNSHVIADSGRAVVGTSLLQPGSGDGGGDSDSIGRLHSVMPFSFERSFTNLCDAATGTVDATVDIDPAIPGIGVPKSVLSASAIAIGAEVRKVGRTTGFTTGVVKDASYRTFMSYPKPGGGRGSAGFRDQVLCTRYSDGGDSGSVVCGTDGTAMGLHWCGTTSTSIFSPLQFVLDELGLILWEA